MPHLTQHDVMTMFLALTVLLGTAKLAGELMHKLGQPSVLGEILAGILLGPTMLGHFKPQIYGFLFPSTGTMPVVLETVTTIGVVFFLLTAGLEIDLRNIFRQGKSALLVSFFGVVIPFRAGFRLRVCIPAVSGRGNGGQQAGLRVICGHRAFDFSASSDRKNPDGSEPLANRDGDGRDVLSDV